SLDEPPPSFAEGGDARPADSEAPSAPPPQPRPASVAHARATQEEEFSAAEAADELGLPSRGRALLRVAAAVIVFGGGGFAALKIRQHRMAARATSVSEAPPASAANAPVVVPIAPAAAESPSASPGTEA